LASREEQDRLIQLGNLAKDVMENEAFHTAKKDAMKSLFTSFLASNADEDDLRVKLWATGQAMDSLRHRLEGMVETAKVEMRNRAEDNQ